LQNKLFDRIIQWTWILLVLSLPITSQPFVAKFARTGSVAPVAGIFLGLIFIFWFVPHIIKRGEIPKQTIPILVFTLWAVIVTLTAFFRENPPYKDINLMSSVLKGLITLLIGVTFYLVTSSYIRNISILKLTLRMVNWGGLVIILWSFFQVTVNLILGDYPHWMDAIQSFFSTGVLVLGRATGLALEPSWLAHQLNMLYLPYWLAAAACRFTAHSFKLWKFHFEDVLLVFGAATLMVSFSRVGMLAFLLMAAFIFIRINIQIIKKVEERIFRKASSPSKGVLFLFRIGFIFLLAIFYSAVIYAIALTFIRFDPRMAGLFQFAQGERDPVLHYANSLKFGERLVYWLAAWKIFGDFPWLGVGLGIAGYYFPTSIVAYGWSLVEVKKLFFHSANLLNIKSLWFRLLAETGIIGFSIFFSWLFIILISSIKMVLENDMFIKVIGLTGILMMIGFCIEGFSIDSFAMPYLWFSAGIVTAGSMIYDTERFKENFL
jgi:hypothetical protein